MSDLHSLRQALIEAIPSDTSYSGRPPPLKYLYVPPAHLKALRPDCQLVVGTRGVGKSVWTAALGNVELRSVLGSSILQLDQTEIRIGFAEQSKISDYPDADSFTDIMKSGADAYTIWRAVVGRWIATLINQPIPTKNWRQTIDWVQKEPENLARLMERASQYLVAQNRYGLILFDALDRLSADWQDLDRIVRGLLRVALWLKPYPRLSAKIFLREDQLQRTVTNFPDASKLLATKAELTWVRHDLHGLLWQYLLNAPGGHGEILREIYASTLGNPPIGATDRRLSSDEVKRETAAQRALFEALAGPWMGRDRRRGVPYVWTVSHLADGQGQTSPRSFLAAIRQAAEDSLDRYPEHQYALHYESIKRGVQKASEIRVNELAEDYSWVPIVLQPLSGLTVPVAFDTILERWNERFPNGPSDLLSGDRLPPQHIERGWSGVREDLLRLGIFEERRDGRIDMPDLYRVGFGLGRRGGVKPRSRK